MNKRRTTTAIAVILCILLTLTSMTYAADNIEASKNVAQTASESSSLADSNTNQTGATAKDDNSAKNNLSSQEKAEVLNKLSIISGDGKGNYNLESQLKRSEAATFIIKVLGKDTYIKENKSKFTTVTFKDIKSSDWFLPYVSYCEQNSIISGLGNGKFGPNQYISEKAFLVLVLKSLGYSSEAGDFSWDTVFNDAYRIGLVSASEYEYKTEDNKEYKRQDVVNVLYEALKTKLKGSSLTLLQSLTNEGVFKREVAYSTGLLNDSKINAISNALPQNKTRVAIVFNEDVMPVLLENIKIYESDRSSKVLSVKRIISQGKDKLVLETDGQIPDKDYNIEISNLTDTEGNIDKVLPSAFKGYKQTEITSDIFKISKVQSVSKNEIHIYFTHPINGNCEVPSYYQIYENDQLFVDGKTSTALKVKASAGERNAVALTINNKVFNTENEYKVKIAGNIVSMYGTDLNNGSGDEASFVPVDLVSEGFSLLGVNGESYNTIKLTFNKPVNPVLAKQIYNYNITDSTNNTLQIKQAAVIDEEGKDVTLTINGALDKTKKYSLMINRLTDIDKEEEIVEKSYDFTGDFPAQIELGLLSVVPSDTETVTLEFNKAVQEESAMNVDNYTITQTSGTYRSFSPDNIYFSKQYPNQVKLIFKSTNALKNLVGYSVKLNPLFKDYTGTSINKVIEYGFVLINSPSPKLTISKAVTISNDTIMLKFMGKDISVDSPNSNAQNYSIEYTLGGETYKKIPIAVTYVDKDTVILKFDSLNSDQTYTLKCNGIKSYAGEVIISPDLQCAVTKGQ